MASSAPSPLIPDPTCLHLVHLEASSNTITVVVRTTAPRGRCPVCQSLSEHIHSRYVRRIADLPWIGWEVQLELQTRRFFCLNLACPRQIFTERLPSVVAPYARRTIRLTEMLTLIGFALGGEAGARLSAGMSLPTSPDTLLSLIRAHREQPTPVPRVLGVDDFSFCKRKSYGTIIIDLEKRVPVDLLPDRESETLAKWLREHPGVQIVSRDRAGPYAEGIRQGAPQAQQVADRWHLLANLSEALKGFFLTKQTQLKALVQPPTEHLSEEEAKAQEVWQASMRPYLEARSLQLQRERVARYEQIHDLAAKKVEVANIARKLKVSRQCVYEYMCAYRCPQSGPRSLRRANRSLSHTKLTSCAAGMRGAEMLNKFIVK